MKPILALLVLLAPGVAASAALELDDLRASVVQVEVVTQGADYSQPWQRPDPSGSGGSAFFIGERRLMTNAHVVSDAKIIRVKRPDRPEKIDARVVFIGHDCDLALLTVDREDFFEGMTPMRFGDVPALRSSVATVGYPIGGRKLSVTEGVVSRIELHDYAHSGADRHLTIQVDAAINPGNSGGPVVQGDRVVGVAFQAQFFAQNIGYVIPVPVIRHFLRDIEDGTYHGYPLLGVLTSNLENPALRSYLGVPEGETGVVVLKALPWSSCSGLIHRNDVIHEVDEYRVENDGTIKVGKEFLELAFVVQEKHVGDAIVVKIRRDGRPMELRVNLKNWDVRMPESTEYDLRPEYLVHGGYVFVPLTSNYVRQSGRRSRLGDYLSEFYVSLAEERPGQEQLVVLSRVLRHDSTRYRGYRNAVVESVNATVPRDFAHFVKLLETGARSVLEFEGVNEAPLVLDREKIAAVHAGILKRYGINEDRHLRGDD